MLTKFYIGSELADFNERFNVFFSIGDFRNTEYGSANKSYTLDLPLTKTNKRLLKFISQADVKSEPTATGRLYIGEMLVIAGRVIVMSYDDFRAKIIISSDDWIDSLKEKKMSELDLSASDHALTHTNVENSWTASYPAYRYPMIDFGGLQSGENGTSAKWWPTDFIPMISIKSLVEAILLPHTISSSWLATAAIKDTFILAKEKILSDAFIRGKNLSAAVNASADNQDTETILPAGSGTASLTNFPVQFLDITENEGLNWTTGDTYVVPETGTYRFKITINSYSTNGYAGFSETGGSFSMALNQTGSATRTLWSVTAARVPAATAYSIDTGYVHLVSGDEIQLILNASSTCTNNTGVPADLVVRCGVGTIELVWGQANRYSGLNKIIELDTMLPDMSQLDFLAAIRDVFNLKFWKDKQRNVIYIEPWDSFVSSTVINLDAYIDHESRPAELISSNYFKDTYLRWTDDSSDKSFEEYYKYNTDPVCQKQITFTSEFAKADVLYKNHPFSSCITGPFLAISDTANSHVRIYQEYPVYPYIMFNRLINFNTRLVKWEGLTAGLTWYYQDETKSTYPKISPVSWTDIYADYWLKYYHYADKGKIYTFRMKITPSMINQFFTVVNAATSEAFRPTYSITINGVLNYFFMQKFTTDGSMAEVEMILKQ